MDLEQNDINRIPFRWLRMLWYDISITQKSFKALPNITTDSDYKLIAYDRQHRIKNTI